MSQIGPSKQLSAVFEDTNSLWAHSTQLFNQLQPCDEVLERQQSEDMIREQKREDSKFPICFECRERIKEKKCVVFGRKKYHLHHFKCSMCKKDLSNFQFFEIGGRIFCENDYNKCIAPICGVCREYIYGKYASGRNNTYHLECFRCTKCQAILGEGQEFFLDKDKQSDKILCKKCKIKLAVKCKLCEKGIIDEEQKFQKNSSSNKLHLKNHSFKNQSNECEYYHQKCLKCVACSLFKEGDFVMRGNSFIHSSCIPSCPQCSLQIGEDEKVVNYFDIILHVGCINSYSSELRKKTMNIFEKQRKAKIQNDSFMFVSSKPKALTYFLGQNADKIQDADRKKCLTSQAAYYYEKESRDKDSSISELKKQEHEDLTTENQDDSFSEGNNIETIEQKYAIGFEQLNNQFFEEKQQIDKTIKNVLVLSPTESLLSSPLTSDRKLCLQGIQQNVKILDQNK